MFSSSTLLTESRRGGKSAPLGRRGSLVLPLTKNRATAESRNQTWAVVVFFSPRFRILPPLSPFALSLREVTSLGLTDPRKFDICAGCLGGIVDHTETLLPLPFLSDHQNTAKYAALKSSPRAAQGNPTAGNLRRGGARLVAQPAVCKEAQGESASVAGSPVWVQIALPE